MRFSLRTKITAAFLLIVTAGFLLISLWGPKVMYTIVEREVISDLYRDANYIAASYKVNSGSISMMELQTIAYSKQAVIYVINVDGTVVTSSGAESRPTVIDGFNPSLGTGSYYMVGDFYQTFDEPMITVYAPLSVSITPQGYVALHYPVSKALQKTDDRLLPFYLVLAGALIMIVLFSIVSDFILIRPAKKIERLAREYANNNLTYQSGIRSNDEYGHIDHALKEIAGQLNRSDDDQHRFMANISHDFRSPLTSIRGYMTAIQDGTIPVEMQGKYINIVLNETDRLMKLANGLLDMTQLENGIMLEKTNFDLNALIREVLMSFEGRVDEKNIYFDVTFEADKQMVNGDRARYLQVVYNLVDNAIKFSKPGSSIDLSTHLRGHHVLVSVRDHGIGISKENLPKIWDRFFKIDSSRGRDKKGTGLGLAIVREIIQAHGEQIDVISTPDVGTEFIFTARAV